MKSNKIYQTFSENFPSNHFIRVGNNRNLSLYIGRDENARYSFDFRGNFRPVKIMSSDVIYVEQFESLSNKTLRFSLENAELLEYFCTFCHDLLDSVQVITDDDSAYKTLRSRYYSWRQLFRPDNARLSESEVMGLIGELLFLKNQMIPKYGIDVALESWMGPEKTHKDFSVGNDWFEIKTISFGKETVRISSIEQLDSEIDGQLFIYELEKMSPNFDGIKLGTLAKSIIELLETSSQRESFMAKLELYGFDFSKEYDSFAYSLNNSSQYNVIQDEFPRLQRSFLPVAITRVQYEISLSEIESFKVL